MKYDCQYILHNLKNYIQIGMLENQNHKNVFLIKMFYYYFSLKKIQIGRHCLQF